MKRLEECSKNETYIRYLALIMSIPSDVQSAVRYVSGLALKVEIEKNFAYFSNESIQYIKGRLLLAFHDPEYNVRKTVGSIMSTLIVKGGFYIWPDLL